MRRQTKAAPAGFIGRAGYRIAVLALGAVALFAMNATAATAAPKAGPGWSYKSSFGEFFAAQTELPRGPVAVDGSGKIFLATDQGQNDWTIRIFTPTAEGGEQLTEFSAGCCSRNIAVDSSGEVMYADSTDTWGSSIKRYVSDGAPTPTFSTDPSFDVPKHAGLAVDPTTGNLLVADPSAEAVLRYDDTGTLLATITTPSIAPSWIVTAPDGSFYVAPAGGSDITHFSGTGTQLGTIAGVGSLHGLAYDPARSLVVAAVEDELKSYSAAGVLSSESSAHSASGTGLAASGSGLLYELDGSNLNLYLPAIVPGVEAPQISSLDTHSVHVSAEVDPGEEPGGEPPAGSFARFEYSSDGGQIWTETPVQALESAGVTTVQADLTGLFSNFDYLVRVVAGNSVYAAKTSTSIPFHTLLDTPETATGPAASITETSAELTGSINALGAPATYHFEYGLTSAYGSRIPTGGEGSAGSERTPRKVSETITGLQPGMTYHYRLVANNAAGEGAGEDQTFTTLAAEPPARGYEQVTPVDKQGASINAAFGFQAAADGSAVSYLLSAAPKDAPSAALFTRYLSQRGSTDWLPWASADPPLNRQISVAEAVTQAISPDFEKSMVISNRALTPPGPNGPYEGGGNIYIKDLSSGAFTFVGAGADFPAFIGMVSSQRENMFLAGAPNFSWITFMSPAPLLPGAPEKALYRWSQDEGLTLQSSSAGNVEMPNSALELSSRWVSEDGTVMYYNLASGAVYRHELDGPTTPISIVENGPEAGTVATGKIDGISSDGRYAFFRSRALTAQAQENGEGTYLYRFDAQTGDLETLGGVISGFPGAVLGVGDDGRTAIFDDSTGLSSWRDGVRHHFTSAQPDLGGGAGYLIFTSPNGRYLVYQQSDGVRLYDAETQVETCVSCLPDGSGGISTGLPTGLRFVSNRMPAVVLDDGTTFFDTTTPLLSADHNGSRDVYSYKDGVLTLISPGDGPYSARFGDATPDGSSIYFTTDQGLVGQDTDKSIDVYDYRLGGGFPGQSPPPPSRCRGGDCQGPAPAGPPGSVPAFVSFPGSGNSARISVSGSQAVTGSSASLKVRVPGAGRIQLSGPGLRNSSLKARKAGSYRLPLRLSQQARQSLKEKHRLRVRVTVRFTPASGEPSSAQTQVTFKQETERKGASR